MGKNNSALVFIFITVLVDIIGIGVIIPVLPELISSLSGKNLNEAAEIGGYLMVSFAVMQFIFSPILGELSDRYGRKPVILMALFGLGINYIMHATATSLAWLFAARLMSGITGASHTVAMAYIADISSREQKAKNFGMVGAAFGLGFIIGPAIGGIFGEIDLRLPFYIAAGLSFVNFIFGLLFVPESLSKEKRRPVKLQRMIPGASIINLGKYQDFNLLLLALFLSSVAAQSLPATWSFFTIEMYGWSEAQVGYSLSVVGIMVAIVQGKLISKVVIRYGSKKVIQMGFIFWTIGMFLFSFAAKPWMLYSFMIPYALGGIAGPTLKSLLSNQVNDSEQGNLQGGITSMISITTIIGPLLASQLFFRFGDKKGVFYFPGAPYLVSSILFLLATIIVYVALRKYPSKENN